MEIRGGFDCEQIGVCACFEERGRESALEAFKIKRVAVKTKSRDYFGRI